MPENPGEQSAADKANAEKLEQLKQGFRPVNSRPKVGESQDAFKEFVVLQGTYAIIDILGGVNPLKLSEVTYNLRVVGVQKDHLQAELDALSKEDVGFLARLVAVVVKVGGTKKADDAAVEGKGGS